MALYKKTLNQMGYMLTQIDEIGLAFLDFAKNKRKACLDIGASFGHIVLEAIKNKTHIIANDLDQRHLDEIEDNCATAHKKYLTLLKGRFPEDLKFEDNSLSAVHISRVLHFFPPQLWMESIETIYNWLEPGGKIFVVNESPFFGTAKSFIPTYNKRLQSGHPYPGLMLNTKSFDKNRQTDVQSLINFLDLKQARALVEDHGFKIELAKYLNRKGFYPEDALYDGRESVAIIAQKPY